MANVRQKSTNSRTRHTNSQWFTTLWTWGTHLSSGSWNRIRLWIYVSSLVISIFLYRVAQQWCSDGNRPETPWRLLTEFFFVKLAKSLANPGKVSKECFFNFWKKLAGITGCITKKKNKQIPRTISAETSLLGHKVSLRKFKSFE